MTKIPSRAARPSWVAREAVETDAPSEEAAVFIPKSFHPPPEGIEIYRVSPAGLLACGSTPFPAFPKTNVLSGIWGELPPTVAGAAMALDQQSSPHSLSAPCGTGDIANHKIEFTVPATNPPAFSILNRRDRNSRASPNRDLISPRRPFPEAAKDAGRELSAAPGCGPRCKDSPHPNPNDHRRLQASALPRRRSADLNRHGRCGL